MVNFNRRVRVKIMKSVEVQSIAIIELDSHVLEDKGVWSSKDLEIKSDWFSACITK